MNVEFHSFANRKTYLTMDKCHQMYNVILGKLLPFPGLSFVSSKWSKAFKWFPRLLLV